MGRARRTVRILRVVSVADMVGVGVGMTMRNAGVVQRLLLLAWGMCMQGQWRSVCSHLPHLLVNEVRRKAQTLRLLPDFCSLLSLDSSLIIYSCRRQTTKGRHYRFDTSDHKLLITTLAQGRLQKHLVAHLTERLAGVEHLDSIHLYLFHLLTLITASGSILDPKTSLF